MNTSQEKAYDLKCYLKKFTLVKNAASRILVDRLNRLPPQPISLPNLPSFSNVLLAIILIALSVQTIIRFERKKVQGSVRFNLKDFSLGVNFN